MTDATTEQTSIDPFQDLNRYDERDEDWPSSAVYEEPRRTFHNGWRKFHAARECGTDRVRYVEETRTQSSDDRYEYRLYCWDCGYEVPEDEVLFIGGEWFSQHGWKAFGQMLENLCLPQDRVLDLGPDPDQTELIQALELTRIEREGSGINGFSFGMGMWYECDGCGHETPLTYDGRCRMCYDGVWTDRMQDSVEALSVAVRERNDSFVHRLPKKLTPSEPGGKATQGAILWRRRESEATSKLVEVVDRYRDVDGGGMMYRVADPDRDESWLYGEEDLDAAFWETGLHTDGP